MLHIQQPNGSSLCGQASVAMLAGVALDASIAACERGRTNTSEHDLRRGLRALGCYLADFSKGLPHRIGARDRLLARVRYEGRRNGYHWIAFDGWMVHDPSHARSTPIDHYERHLKRIGGYITSTARVVDMPKRAVA